MDSENFSNFFVNHSVVVVCVYHIVMWIKFIFEQLENQFRELDESKFYGNFKIKEFY